MRGSLGVLFVALFLAFMVGLMLFMFGCVPTWKEVTPHVGEYETKVSIVVQEEWCKLKGVNVYGFTKYNTIKRDFCVICVSLKSNDPEKTIRHEMDHCWRNSVGLDAKARNE